MLDDAVRTNDTNVASAWSSLESSKSFLNSVKVQVRASKIANEGIAAEIVGYKKDTMTYGLYSGGNSAKSKFEAIEKIKL